AFAKTSSGPMRSSALTPSKAMIPTCFTALPMHGTLAEHAQFNLMPDVCQDEVPTFSAMLECDIRNGVRVARGARLLHVMVDPAHPASIDVHPAHRISRGVTRDRVGKESDRYAVIFQRVIHQIRLRDGHTCIGGVGKNEC